MKTLIHGVGGDAEHLGHIGDRKLFPCHEPEDFGVGAAEACCCLEHEPTLVGLDGRLVAFRAAEQGRAIDCMRSPSRRRRTALRHS